MLPVVLASYYIVVLTRNNGAGFGTIVIVIIFCSLSIVVLFSFRTLGLGNSVFSGNHLLHFKISKLIWIYGNELLTIALSW